MLMYTWPWLKWHHLLKNTMHSMVSIFLRYRIRYNSNYLCNFVTLPNTLNVAFTIVTNALEILNASFSIPRSFELHNASYPSHTKVVLSLQNQKLTP